MKGAMRSRDEEEEEDELYMVGEPVVPDRRSMKVAGSREEEEEGSVVGAEDGDKPENCLEPTR